MNDKFVILSRNNLSAKIDENILSELKDGVIFVPQITCNSCLFHNARNFPNLFDIIVKKIPFFRKLLPQRMRKYLNWDLSESSPTEIDWGTYDFMILKKSFYDKYKDFIDLNSPFNDLFLSLKAHEKGFKIYYVPSLKIQVSNTTNFSFLSKFFNFIKFRFQLLLKNELNYPSKNYKVKKSRILKTNILNKNSIISKVGKSFQKNNKVVQILEASVYGHYKYKQPLVYSSDSVLALVINKNKEIGLIEIWRHAPLKIGEKNLFPIFPETTNLGIYSIEAIRGGVEKKDKNLEKSIMRELKEEINLDKKFIKSIKPLSISISNTAWDVFSTNNYLVEVDTEFNLKVESEEHIKSFRFYSIEDVKKLISDDKILCALTKSAILEFLTLNNL